jgi:hypothetical protein
MVFASVPRVLATGGNVTTPTNPPVSLAKPLPPNAKQIVAQYEENLEKMLAALKRVGRRPVPYRLDKHVERLLLLYKAGQVSGDDRRAALESLGVSWHTEIRGDMVSRVLVINGRTIDHARTFRNRRPPAVIEQPDGGEALRTFDEVDDQVDAAIATGEADIAYYEATADEIDQSVVDIEQWMGEHSPVLTATDTPGELWMNESPGVSCDSKTDDIWTKDDPCWTQAAQGIVNGFASSQLLQGAASAVRSGIQSLTSEVSALRSNLAAGLIGWGTFETGALGAVGAFVGSLNLTWVAGAAAAALAGWYLYEFIDCLALMAESESLSGRSIQPFG